MKSNKTKIFMLGAMALLTSAAFTSCEDVNDWKTDSAYDRLFCPTSLSVSAEATDAEVTWKSTPGTQFYVIELSTDSLYGLQDEFRATSQIIGMDGSVTKSPFQLADLNNSTKYYIRVKACSMDKSDSNWAYPEKFFFTTKSENILNAITTADKGEDYITMSWDASLAVTHVSSQEILGTSESGETIHGEEIIQELTAENKADGNVTISGLKASTGYLLSIYNNETVRGTRVATTTMALPDADLTVTIHEGETLTQDMIDSWEGKQSITVAFQANGVYDIVGVDRETGEIAGLSIPTGMSITLYGIEGESKPQLNMQREIVFKGTHGFFRMINVDVVDAGAQYLFNQGIAMSAVEVSFTDCNFTNFARNIVRCKDQVSVTIDDLKFNNCIFTNQGSGNYPLIGLDARTYTVTNIEFNDCTFNTIRHNVILLNHGDRGLAAVNTVSFNNCTLYNAVGGTRYLLDAGSTSQGPTVTLNNTIIGKTFGATLSNGVWSSTSRGIRTQTINVINTYSLADGVFGSNDIKNTIKYDADSDAVFTDPANGNFSIKDRNFPEGVGASCWYAE